VVAWTLSPGGGNTTRVRMEQWLPVGG
jgi:hypothetical protein